MALGKDRPVAVSGSSVYTLGTTGEHEHVISLNEATGELHWRVAIGPAINDAPLMRWLSQRTPTIDAERLYASTAQGDLVCLQTADGKELWRKNYPKDFGALKRSWGYVDRPLVDGDNLICSPGGTEATLVALNKFTGDVVWKCVLDPPEAGSYPAMVLKRTAEAMCAVLRHLVGVRAADGKLLWRHASQGLGWVNTLTPLVKDGYIISSGGRNRSEIAVFKSNRHGDQVTVEEIARTRLALDHFQDSTVCLGDYLYTSGSGGVPVCIEWRTGKTYGGR
jgi:outer membrane protein assembly factor BamB